MNDNGIVRFDWVNGCLQAWDGVSMNAVSGPNRIEYPVLEANKDKAYVLTEVEFIDGIPTSDGQELFLTLAGIVTITGTLCYVAYDMTGIPGRFFTAFSKAGDIGAKPNKTYHPTIGAAMTDFCNELMLVNPYDHIKEIIKERDTRATYYQTNEEFGSWA